MNDQFWQVFWNLNRNKRVKTPTILQMEAVECGAASLGIVLAYYGRIVSLPELRIECGVSRDGSKASNLILAARRYGMEAKGFKVEDIEQLEEFDPPYLVFWNFNHYLVVEGITPHRIYLNDPAVGHRTVTRQEFDQKFTGVILVMNPTEDFQKGGQKTNVLGSIFSRLRYSKKAIAYSLLAGLILVLPGLAIPIFSQFFVDYILIENFTHWLYPLLLGMLLTALLQAGLSLLRLRYLRKLGIKLAIVMSSQFLWHILHLPMSFYAQRYAGEISNRGNLNNKIAQILSGQLATTVIDAILIIFYAIVMFAYDWVLTLIGIGFSLINILMLYWVRKQRIDANLQLGQDLGKVSAVSISGLSTIETLKASALESDFFARWSGYYTKAINVQQTLEISNQILAILPIFLTYLTTIFILIVGGFRVMEGELTIGMLVAFQSLMQSFQRPITTLVDFGSVLQELEGDLVRLDDVLTHPIDTSLDKLTITQNSITENKLTGAITLDNITFGYSPVEPPLIENFSLTLSAGQRVALVGSSGSGKSTIGKLICGLYQPWKGEIYFDGIPQSQIPRQVLANSLSMVEQSIFFFAGTVRDNLTLWDDTIPHEQLIKACQDAEIHEVIMKLTGGYDGKLLEGGMNLSGGQRQRLEIARALVQNPSILVMDEATSALDTQTEQLIVENIRQRGCSCILVAHRLSTIRDCDEIIVLEKGKVVQRGTHQQLWEQGGIYADLIRYEG